jgi:hypothetical protein
VESVDAARPTGYFGRLGRDMARNANESPLVSPERYYAKHGMDRQRSLPRQAVGTETAELLVDSPA